jgi:hypothetical protein
VRGEKWEWRGADVYRELSVSTGGISGRRRLWISMEDMVMMSCHSDRSTGLARFSSQGALGAFLRRGQGA